MPMFSEYPYVLALKECYLSSRCSSCFKKSSIKCSSCNRIVYCNEECRLNDSVCHEIECEMYRQGCEEDEYLILRMIIRVIIRLSIDGGQPKEDLCENVPETIVRRCWSDLLGHRDEIIHSERHFQQWIQTKKQFQRLFPDRFQRIDLLEIFGKLLINRFRVGIFENLFEGRIAVGWAIYLTTSIFNHSCQPDLLQCSFDIVMRLKFANDQQSFPTTNQQFNQLTVSYRHQNDFRLTDSLTYLSTRKQRRQFVNFFFFNCHCSFCNDDLRNRYLEALTNRTCQTCGDLLVLQKSYEKTDEFHLMCLGRRKCLQTGFIIQTIKLSFIEQIDQYTIDICEQKLDELEQILHPKSILLLQQKEKIFFAYQKLIQSNHFNNEQSSTLIQRAIQIGQFLLQAYDLHIQDSSIYPKIFLTDLAQLYETIQQTNNATILYQKAFQLWTNDYKHFLDYRQFLQKLSIKQ